MTSKRDVQLVRLACKWRWMTAEQGEACLALERKLGGRRTIEEIIKNKGGLDEAAIASLVEAADRAGARRRPLFSREAPPEEAPARPVVLPRSEQTVVRAIDFLAAVPEAPAAPSGRPSRRPRPAAHVPSGLPRDARRAQAGPGSPAPGAPPPDPTRAEMFPPGDATRIAPSPWDTRLGAAIPAVEDNEAASEAFEEPELPAGVAGSQVPSEVTRFEPLPWFKREEDVAPGPLSEPELPAASRESVVSREVTRFEPGAPAALQSGSFESAERTILAELPVELLARLRGPDPDDEPPTGEVPVDDVPTGDVSGTIPLEDHVDVPVLPREPMASHSEATAPEPLAPPPAPAPQLYDLSGRPRAESARPTLLDTPMPEPPPRPREVSVLPYHPPVVTEEARPAAVSTATASPGPGLQAPLRAPSVREASVLPIPDLDVAPSLAAREMSLLEEPGLAEGLLGAFGPYELERVVARGGASVVYLARDVEAGTRVAVKVLARTPAENQAFISERGGTLIAAAGVRSPYVVRILDVGRVDDRHYVALEYVDGWSLADKLDFEEAPPPARAFAWASQIAAALAATHALGVLHGDVRPARVLIDPTSRARLSGFGFAPLTPRPDDPGAPPEGRRDTPAADAYGLGRVLKAGLTGAVPEAPLPASLPGSARALVESLLDEDPDARPRDFEALATTLAEYAELLEREVPEAETAEERPPVRGLVLRAAAIAAGLVVALLTAMAGVRGLALPADLLSQVVLHTALAGAAGLGVATLLLATMDLIRRGELPLPVSTQWLVQVGEAAGALGALLVVVQVVLGPPAAMNAIVAAFGVGLAFSAVLGVVLRRAVAQARADGGVGRMLAVLSDPWMTRWRTWHGPALTTLALLAGTRFAMLAYFAAS